jgi:peptidyl-prolyl cis-trans isomerase B (cyclophilin B)
MTRRHYYLLAVALMVFLAACGSQPEPETAAEPQTPVEETIETAEPAAAEEEPVVVAEAPTPPPVAPTTPPAPVVKTAPTGPPVVVVETSMGAIRIELFADKAPKSVANFLAYVDDKYYDGTIFHRVMSGFMIQGGGFTPDMSEKNGRAPIENESRDGESNARGTIAMARTGDPHSATAQFYINHADNRMLDFGARSPGSWGYAVFGRIIEGMDVVDAIAAVPTGNNGRYENVPVGTVTINSVRRAN